VKAGQTIGHYHVLSLLGKGGMGEVYLARDTRLDRQVALKILPAELAEDRERMRRFTQEAKTAAAIHHPNIAQIFEIGEHGQIRFIAMEFVEGETLRQLLGRRKIEIRRAVELAAQVASGLSAAHKKGVIHRDIKPENLIVTAAGQAKILDFGLAKLIEKQPGASGGDELTTIHMRSGGEQTTPGMIMGTVSYMSPEQARGEKLDQRTDIFSLGLVLYEMLTGERAFQGKSAIDTLHAIINQELPSVTQLTPKLPNELDEILAKALAKDANERYQHAGDFELDLRRFKHALETNSLLSSQTRAVAAPRAQPATKLLVAAAVAAVVLLGVAAFAWMLGRASAPSKQSQNLESVTLTPLTTEPGYEGEPTFSPDGQTIAYVSNRTGNFDIFLKQVSGGPDVQLTTSTADDVQPSFSPDGKQIAFVSTRSSSSGLYYPVTDSPQIGGDIWVMSALGDTGGNARRIVENGNFPSWSPDGKFILYIDVTSHMGRSPIYQVPATGGAAHEITLKFAATGYTAGNAFYPHYSSDGRWITFQEGSASIYVVSADGGDAQFVARGVAPTWDANSAAIIYSSKEPGKNLSLWRIPFSRAEGKTTGLPSALTVSRGWNLHAAVARDGKMIAFTGEDVSFNVETIPFEAEQGRVSGEPKPLTTGQNINFFINFSPDAHSIVFESTRGSSTHIWRADANSPPVQLTSDPNFNDTYPRWSPDGRSIAFNRSPVGKDRLTEIWLMTEDGANPQLLAEKISRFAWMPDSRAIVAWTEDSSQLVVIDLETKQRRALTNESGVVPIISVSSDGKWIAYHSNASGNMDVRAVPFAGGESRAVVTSPHYDVHPFFSPSGRWLYYQRDHKNIYRVPGPAQDWRKAEPEKVTNFPESGLFLEDPQISRDGRQLLYSRARITGDIWIMNLER